VIDPDRATAELRNSVEAVRHEHDRASRGELGKGRPALLVEVQIPDGQDLVEQQYVRFDADGRRKSQARHHAGRVPLERGVHVVAYFRKLQNLIDTIANLAPAELHERAVQARVSRPERSG
jgi:hypothetical protein